jgi:hypothetical protein
VVAGADSEATEVHGVGVKLAGAAACLKDGGWSLASVATCGRSRRRRMTGCLGYFLAVTCCSRRAFSGEASGRTGGRGR